MSLIEALAVVRELAAAHEVAVSQPDLAEPVGIGEGLARGRDHVRLSARQDALRLIEGRHPAARHDGDLVARGEADFVAAARQTLADPDWFRKIRLGHGDLVRRCEFTNYCEGLDQHHKQVTCKLWDRVDVDAPGVRRAADGKRRLSAPAWAPPR